MNKKIEQTIKTYFINSFIFLKLFFSLIILKYTTLNKINITIKHVVDIFLSMFLFNKKSKYILNPAVVPF